MKIFHLHPEASSSRLRADSFQKFAMLHRRLSLKSSLRSKVYLTMSPLSLRCDDFKTRGGSAPSSQKSFQKFNLLSFTVKSAFEINSIQTRSFEHIFCFLTKLLFRQLFAFSADKRRQPLLGGTGEMEKINI